MPEHMVEVIVGRVARAHGTRGDVAVVVRTDEPARRFAPGAVVHTTAGRTLRVTSSRPQGAGPAGLLVRFDGITDRNGAEALRGLELLADVAVTELPSGADEFFDRQLIGLDVLDAGGRRAGRVADVIHGPAQDILVIEADAGQRLVPFVAALVPEVDLGAGTLRLADVQGLLADEEGDQ